MKKRRVFSITPVTVNCTSCDSSFYDSGGGQKADLTSLFLEILKVEIVGEEKQQTRFCPFCSLQLRELQLLLKKLDTLNCQIEKVKQFVFQTSVNTAFRLKYGNDVRNVSTRESSSSFVTLREKVMENWIALSQNPVPVSTIPSQTKPKIEPTEGMEETQDMTTQYPILNNLIRKLPKLIPATGYMNENPLNGLDHHEEISVENVNDVIVEEVTDIEENNEDDDAASRIRIEPGSWRTISDPKDFPGSSSPSNNYNDTELSYTITQVDTDEEANNDTTEMSSFYKEKSDYYSNQEEGQNDVEYTFMEDQTEVPTSVSSSCHEAIDKTRTERPIRPSGFSCTPPPPKLIAMTSLKQLQQRKASIPTLKPLSSGDQKEIYVQMCTLCYKYIINGDTVGHLCEGKSTTSRYQCGYCNSVCLSEKVLEDHVHRHLLEKRKGTNVPTKFDLSVQTCKICRKRFATVVALQAHFQSEHGVSFSQCQQCSKVFSDATKLRLHMITHNRNSDHGKGATAPKVRSNKTLMRSPNQNHSTSRPSRVMTRIIKKESG